MEGMLKVPFRQVYCDTFVGWLKATLWCHLVIKVFPFAVDLGSDSLLDDYVRDPAGAALFYGQYEGFLRRARIERAKATAALEAKGE